MKKLKIGLFIDSFFPMVDGVVMVVDNYARRLCQSAEVTVFAPGSKQKGFDDSVFPYRVVRSKILKVPKLDYVLPCPGVDRKFKRAMEEAALDIVHLHSPATIGRAGLAHARKHNIPVVAHMHSQFKRDFSAVVSWKWFVNLMMKYAMKIYNRCDVCWAVNGEIARLLYEDYGCKVKPTVQQNATEMLPLEDPQKARALDERYGILPGEKVFLFVGRLVLVKGILFLADALKVLKDRGLKFRMFFVGSGQEGEIRLRKRLEELELSECILTGSVSDREELRLFYARADLFLFPSLYDANSIVQIEAASQRTPSVFLEGAATASTVTADRNGYLAPNDPAAFADKILAVLPNELDRLTPEESEKKRTAFESVREHAFRELYLTWDQLAEKVLKDYEKIVADYRSEHGEKR